ncbi:MAG: flagellar filament capping protein FliD [Leptothrix sp. (in: b-proteobacteria)]
MASISSAGIGSGLDVNSIVTQLMGIERQPLTNMQTAASKLQDRLSSYGKIQSYVSSLRDAADKLSQPTSWGQTTAASGDTSVLAATTSDGSVAGSYGVTVQQLASSQTLASSSFGSNSATVGSGSLHIDLGSWNADQSGFTPSTTASPSGGVDVTISSTDTLSEVRDKINAAGAGVNASIVNDTSGARLVLQSSSTGAGQAFRITASDADGNNGDAAGLSALAYDPSAGVSRLNRTQAGVNAQATINGLAVSSASNTLSDVIQGVSIKLSKVSSTPVDLTIAQDSTSIKKSVNDFANAYNSLDKYLTDQTSYDASTKTSGPLQGDSAVNALRAQIRNIVTDTFGGSGAFKRLSEIGLDPQANGTLTVNASKLDAAMSNSADVKTLFSASDSSSVASQQGFATRLRQWGDTLLGIDGAITTRSGSLQRQIDANTKQQDSFQLRMTTVEQRMRAQYTALDTEMSKLNSLSSYVTQQLAAINKTA